jgi:hypothetical protein
MPSDLLRSVRRSAFNIGHVVEFCGLELQESETLLAGLMGKVLDLPAVLDAMLKGAAASPS